MLGKVSPLFQLFDKQYTEARFLFNALGKNFKSKKALELEDKLIFINVYLHVLNKIHFREERLKYEFFVPFRGICKALKRIHHYKLVIGAFEEEKPDVSYNSYEERLRDERKKLYKDVFEVIISTPQDIWESLYVSGQKYSKGLTPLMVDTATSQLINEELEYFGFDGGEDLDNKSLRDVLEGLQIITVLENIRVGVGLNPLFTSSIHGEMKALRHSLVNWNKTYLFAQHLNLYLSENEQVGSKYLDLARKLKTRKQRLTLEVISLCRSLFSKVIN